MAKYNKAIVERITSMIRADTYTQREICAAVGVDETTFGRWKTKYPEFAEAIEDAEDERMARMVVIAKKSLKKKIEGYTVSENKIVSVPTNKKDEKGKSIGRIKEMTTTEKYVHPDTAAIIFTLVNGDPMHWKNRVNNEVTGKDGKELFAELTDEELERKIEEFEKKSK